MLDGCDLLCLSGGVPPQLDIVQSAIAKGIRLSNDSLLTMQICRRHGLGPLIAVTGSSGKTTTTTLVGEMLAAAGLRVHVGGNIGIPLIDRLRTIGAGEPIVLEMSSFQLELFDPAIAYGPLDGVGPDIVAILNITPNHLDRHETMVAYAGAKLNLLSSLPSGAAVVLSADDAVTAELIGDRNAPPAGQAHSGEQGLPAQWGLTELLAQGRDMLAARHATLIAVFVLQSATRRRLVPRRHAGEPRRSGLFQGRCQASRGTQCEQSAGCHGDCPAGRRFVGRHAQRSDQLCRRLAPT